MSTHESLQGRPSEPPEARRPDLDWLRVLSVWSIIPYHAARIFDLEPFFVNASPGNRVIDFCRRRYDPWGMMALQFFLAGASTRHSLSKRTLQAFLNDRTRRLLLPFVSGVLLLAPIQTYYARASRSTPPAGGLFSQYSDFFRIRGRSMSGYEGGFTPSHLWFILYLYVFSLVAALLLKPRIVGAADGWLDGLACRCDRHPGLLFAFAGPLVLVRLGRLPFPDPAFFFLTFVYGCLLASRPAFRSAIEKAAGSIAASAALGFAASIFLQLGRDGARRFASSGPSPIRAFIACNAWLWLLQALGFASRRLTARPQLPGALQERSYTIYLVHQSILVTLGFHTLRTNLPILLKFSAITIGTAGLSWLSHGLLRRFRLGRLLFGIR